MTARAEAEAYVDKMLASGDPLREATGRMIRKAGFAFEDAVNDEIGIRFQAGEDEWGIFNAAMMMLGQHWTYLADHMVVRGIPRAQAMALIANTVAEKIAYIEHRRAAEGYVPMPKEGTGQPFDFRKMMTGEG